MPRKSKILDAVYQTAKDFHEVGVMPKTTMHRFEKRCIPQVHPLEPEEIMRLC